VQHCQPYSGLAAIYDRVMDHVHYKAWEQYIVSRFMRYHASVTSILEIACGTGSFSQYLLSDNYRVPGVDI